MKLSTKGRYALIALIDLAQGGADAVMRLSDIAERQDVSLTYLEQLFMKIRRAGLVESRRGPGGGYAFSRPISDIRLSEILTAVDENMDALTRGQGASGAMQGSEAERLADKLWEQLSANIYVFLYQTRLSDIANDRMMPCPIVPNLIELVDE